LCALLTAVAAASAGGVQPSTIRTDVNLVQVQVKVTDSRGRIVTGLEKSAFELLADKEKQEITVFQGEDAPVTAGIVVDNSASMAPKRKDVIAAATEFARDSNPLDQMFVLHFNERSRFGLPPGKPFTSDMEELKVAIAAFQLGGTTAFYDALIAAMNHLREGTYPRRVLLAITDGGDNSSSAGLPDAIARAAENGTAIFGVGIFDSSDQDRNPAALDRLSESTGAQSFFPATSKEIPAICKQIAREIRQEYTLGFAGKTDGRYHEIRVLVHDGKHGPLHAFTRAGYLAAKP
jgi:VWFA-related protein